MQELPKEISGKEPKSERKGESGDDPCWAEEFNYYYDDAHGYEPYRPEAEEEDEEAETAGEDLS